MPFGTFSLAASQFNHDIEFTFDSTPILLFFGVPIPDITVQPQSYDTTMVTLRFASAFEGPVNFVSGLYYQKDENDFDVHVSTTDGFGNAVPWDPLNANDAPVSTGTAFFGRFRKDEIEQGALFGAVTWDFMERWQLLAGFRRFGSSLESRQATTHAFAPSGPSPAAGVVVGTTVNGNAIGLLEPSDDTIRPKASVSFQWTEEVLFYALYSEGFRTGGVNDGNQRFAPGIPATYASDELTLAFSDTHFFDHELTETQPVLPGASPFVIVGREGDEIPNTPDTQLYASLRWDTPVWTRAASFLVDLNYRGKTNTEFVPTSPFNIEIDSFTVVNLFANVQIDRHFSVGLYAKNVTDELAVYDGIGTFQDPQAIVANRPRTLGFNVRWQYCGGATRNRGQSRFFARGLSAQAADYP